MSPEILSIIKDVGSVVGVVLSCITLLTLAVKPLRTSVVRFVERISGSNETDRRLNEMTQSIQDMREALNHHITSSSAFHETIMEDIAALKEADAAELGNTIKHIYNKYKDAKALPEREYEVLLKLYHSYHDVLLGNGVVERMYTEIVQEWTIEFE